MKKFIRDFKKALSKDTVHFVFDWCKAAMFIRRTGCSELMAGLSDDWSSTADDIYVNNSPNNRHQAYLISTWATPSIMDENEVFVPCFKVYEGRLKPGDVENFHMWSPESLIILKNKMVKEPVAIPIPEIHREIISVRTGRKLNFED